MKQLLIKLSNGIRFAIETNLPDKGPEAPQNNVDRWLKNTKRISPANFVFWLRKRGYACDLLQIEPV